MASSSSSSLAPGFRFHPTDEELVIYYLKRKICGKPFRIDAISEVDIYKFEPWDLPDRSRLKSRDLEWYFFSGLDKKYGNGWRTNRATDQGYWKTTGKDRPVHHGEKTVGMKKTLVFHIGRAPHGERTNWVMHEYRLVDEELVQAGVVQDAFVLCRVFRKSGPGPKNGERYGAPFLEEEWDDSVSNVKNEFENDAYSGLGDNEYVQPQQEYYEDHALATIPPNELPVGPDGGEGWNHPENYGGSSEDDKKVFIGTGEISGMMELPDEKMFVVPEQFQLDQRPNENEYFSVDDFLNTVDGSNQAENHLDGELRYSNASQDPLVFDESFITVDDPNSFEADQDPFKMLDEYIKYFDATDNDSNLVALDSPEVSEFGVPYLNQSAFTEEQVNAQNEQVCLAPPESPETHGDEGASSSEQTPEIPKITEDAKYNSGWDSSIAKQVSRMLGSIPAPTAFAGEIPTKEAAFGQSSSSSIHVTAGMIHISGMTVGGEKLWSLGKSGNADLLLPYRMTMGDVNLLGNSFGPMGNTLSSKASSVVLRSGFYFMFLWVLILSVSCKIGSYIYARQYL